MIPKKIHYCWFGHGPKPKLAKKCIKSWKRHCPDYEMIEWNEDNFDITAAPLYVRQAFEAKKWAFVTDYVRLKVVYDHGGIYLDTDVELKKPLDSLRDHTAYFGFEDGKYINTGLGFGATKGAPILAELMEDYQNIRFTLPDGTYDTKPCPVRNTEVFLRHGLRQDDSMQTLPGDILILPSSYFCPYSYDMQLNADPKKAYSIHWFSASWFTPESRRQHDAWVKELKKDRLRHAPNRFLISLLGDKRYGKLKKILKRRQ